MRLILIAVAIYPFDFAGLLRQIAAPLVMNAGVLLAGSETHPFIALVSSTIVLFHWAKGFSGSGRLQREGEVL